MFRKNVLIFIDKTLFVKYNSENSRSEQIFCIETLY